MAAAPGGGEGAAAQAEFASAGAERVCAGAGDLVADGPPGDRQSHLRAEGAVGPARHCEYPSSQRVIMHASALL